MWWISTWTSFNDLYIFYKMFALLPDKPGSFGAAKNENMSHKELAEGSHKPTVRKFKKRKIYPSFCWSCRYAINK